MNDAQHPDRRCVLRLGASGLCGLTLGSLMPRIVWADEPDLSRIPKSAPRADAVIHIFLPGGIAAQESFDPKPLAPIEFRGELRSIGTKVSGLQFSELLPRLAEVADRLTLIRAMSHGEADHERGTHNMLTGTRPSPALIYPSMGSVVAHELGPRQDLPPYVCIPTQASNFSGSGYLSSATSPFCVGGEPSRKGFRVRDLELPQGVDAQRFERRRGLLDAVNAEFRGRERSGEIDAMDEFYRQAYALISAPKARAAFDLDKEPDALRDRYGRNEAGQRFLLARRLVEGGVRFVSTSYGGWDMHDQVGAQMRRQLPPFDQALAALIADLDARGLLARTLVLVTSEFGRTPKVNKTGGRDHWPKVFTTVAAGGGMKRGFVYGATDLTATEPEEDALSVEDWAATVFSLLGLDPERKLLAPGNRPIPLVADGKVRRELLA